MSNEIFEMMNKKENISDDIERTNIPYVGLNRTMCGVLDEMRSCHKTHNYAPILGLIEEIQSMGNRMESSMQDVKDFKLLYKARRNLKREVLLLEKYRNKLRKETGKVAER